MKGFTVLFTVFLFVCVGSVVVHAEDCMPTTTSASALVETTWTLPLRGAQAAACLGRARAFLLEHERSYESLRARKDWVTFGRVITVGEARPPQKALKAEVERVAQDLKGYRQKFAETPFARANIQNKTLEQFDGLIKMYRELVGEVP